MSNRRLYPIQCPRCQASQEVELYESLNIKEQPELKQLLMTNQLNAVTCPACQFQFRVDKNLLYSDPDRRLLIYWIPATEQQYEQGEDTFSELVQNMTSLLPSDLRAPEVHLVFNRTELVERIFLLEAGLDVRTIEYIKYSIYTRNTGKLDPVNKILLFNAQDSTPEHLCFVIQDAATRKFEAMLQYERAVYTALSEAFADGEKAADLLELFPGPHVSARALLLQEIMAEVEEENPPPAPPPAG
jgi:hypothetical protein